MIKSLFSGVTGLKSHNQRMDVIGNNIANVNTTAYKANNVTFKDVFYQTKKNGSAGTTTSGGVNSMQVGYGTKTGTIGQIMSQSGLTYSDSVYDCALMGEGFFQVMDPAGNIYYTRNGVFGVDDAGNLTDANGYIVLGVSGDPTGIDASSQRISINVPTVDNSVASVTKTINGYEIIIKADGYGEDGNITLKIDDSKSPFATYSNGTLAISMDLSADFQTASDFQDALNAAIRAGGVNIPNVTPLSVEFPALPASIDAVSAKNIMEFSHTDTATSTTTTFELEFEAVTAGEVCNKYQINMRTTTGTAVTAEWSGDVLTISVPEGSAFDATTITAIQDAIDAASTEDTKQFTVTLTGTPGALTAKDFLPDLKRLGMTGGKDNFFTEMVDNIGLVKLVGGHTYKEQFADDLDSVFIDSSGVIYGEHAVHGTLILGRIDLVTFENPQGLDRIGTSYWKESLASGEATVKQAGMDGAADIVSGALEMSNVDLSQEFSDMIITQRGFQANSRIITVSDTMLEELVNLKR